MSAAEQAPDTVFTDGTSQAGRGLRWLDPAGVPLDERGVRELLAFARAHARELNYYGLDNQVQGDWSALLGSTNAELDLDALADYAERPERYTAAAAEAFARPHLALLLVFLRLLGRARERLNAVTGRHLDFFYRDMLRMVGKLAVPDRVHVLLELDRRTEQLRLPDGTLLRAGKDSLGVERSYRTQDDLIANRVQVAQVATARAALRVTRIPDASKPFVVGGLHKEGFVAMLRIALGQPDPGDPLPLAIYPGCPPAPEPGKPPAAVDFAALEQAQRLIAAVGADPANLSGLCMPLFDDFRLLMRLKKLRSDNDAGDWAKVNDMLGVLAARRGAAPAPTFSGDDFLANLRTALGCTAKTYAHYYDGLPEVKSIEQAYAACLRPERQDVRDFISSVNDFAGAGLFLTLDEFRSMMQTKLVIDNQWDEITRLLEEAGRRKRKDAAYALPDALRGPRGFDAKLADALGKPDYAGPTTLDAYFASFLAVEAYFYMPAEQFAYIMAVAGRATGTLADSPDWQKVYAICADAHAEMIYTRRRGALLKAAQGLKTDAALAAMLTLALGEPLQTADALLRLKQYKLTDDDLGYVVDVAAGAVPAPDQNRLAAALEIAQRNRENFTPPVAEKLDWFNLYPQPDARAVAVAGPGADATALPRWRTFGAVGGLTPQDMPDAHLGWAISSPLLTLSEGSRTVAIALGFAADGTRFQLDKVLSLLAPTAEKPGEATFNPFIVQLSGAKGWIDPATVSLTWATPAMGGFPPVPGVDPSTLRTLVISVTLTAAQPALAAPSLALHGFDAAAPALRLVLHPWWNADQRCYQTAYQLLRGWMLVRAQLAVMVRGLTHLRLRNDQGTLDPKKPFEPFGSSPSSGARLYIGHPELASKRLDGLRFRFVWMGAPASLETHYTNYEGGLKNSSFTALVGMGDRGAFVAAPTATTLFDDGASTAGEISRGFAGLVDRGTMDPSAWAPADVGEWNSHIVWELANDFRHPVYPTLALKKSLALAAVMAKPPADGVKPETYQVNPPYTPKLKSLQIDYQTTVNLAFDRSAGVAPDHPVWHLHPFGVAPMIPDDGLGASPFLPQYDDEGELYIGLANVAAPQTLSLLFQMAEGSADPDLPPQPVSWSFLTGDRWLSLQDGSLLADGTRGLINSGIVKLALRPALPSTRMPAGLYWLRLTVPRAPESVCDAVQLHPNAVLATFEDAGNAPDHLSRPLPPKSITALADPLPGLAKLLQPYSSFGGKMPERAQSFNLRVSERLRHKQRALSPWDYERLVLAKFPQLHKVKCLRADPRVHPGEPGRIDLVVIPDIRERFPFNPFEPKAPADLVRDIEEFLADKTPPQARVKVRNARFVALMVRVAVRFMPGQDEGFCRKRLNDEFNRFLSPWAYDEGADIVIGGRIYASSIIDFIEGCDYVDYVAELKLFTNETGNFALIPPSDDYHAETSGPDGILVAAPEHEFDLISDSAYSVDALRGINYMKVELDFIVA